MRGKVYRITAAFSVLTLCVYGILMYSSQQFYKHREVSPSTNETVQNFLHNSSDSIDAIGKLSHNISGTINTGIPKERHHVALLKVHKTGSSTVQNIFLRFADSRNLTLILGHDNKTLSETSYANVISYKQSLAYSNIVPPPEGRHYDILCCHVIYDRIQFQMYLPNDTAYIGIVREPISRTESAIRYFGALENSNLTTFAKDPLKHARGEGAMIGNRMAFEFGFPSNLFPGFNENYGRYLSLKPYIDSYIVKLFSEFDLIMINERLSESLVLMKRILGWKLKDIIYVDLNVAKGETRRFSAEDRENLNKFLYLDIALYNYALQQLQKMIDREGIEFQEEVKHFLEVKESIKQYCNGTSSTGFINIRESKWSNSFTVTHKACELYNIFETHYIQILRQKQYGRKNN